MQIFMACSVFIALVLPIVISYFFVMRVTELMEALREISKKVKDIDVAMPNLFSMEAHTHHRLNDLHEKLEKKGKDEPTKPKHRTAKRISKKI